MPQVGSQNEPLHERALFGWDGDNWRRVPLVWGYSGFSTGEVFNASGAAGANVLQSSAVPAGEIWEVQAIAARDETSAITSVIFSVVTSSLTIVLSTQGAFGANVWASWTGKIMIPAGSTVVAQLGGVTLNDDIRMRFHATKMIINE